MNVLFMFVVDIKRKISFQHSFDLKYYFWEHFTHNMGATEPVYDFTSRLQKGEAAHNTAPILRVYTTNSCSVDFLYLMGLHLLALSQKMLSLPLSLV